MTVPAANDKCNKRPMASFISKKNTKIILTIVMLVVIIFVSARGGSNPVKGAVLGVSSPFLKTFRVFSGGAAGFFGFLGSIGDLKEENENLIKENQEIMAENIRLKDVKKENEKLRSELDLLPREKYDLEASFIIAQDQRNPGSRMIIDKGKDNGLKPGLPLVVSKSTLVGRISEVFSSTAIISLVTDPSSAVNAEVSDSGAKGILKGEYGTGLKLDMISQSEIVKEGDSVITSGLGEGMPRGLFIGKVDKVFQSEDKLFQQATILPAANLSDLRVVFAIKNF